MEGTISQWSKVLCFLLWLLSLQSAACAISPDDMKEHTRESSLIKSDQLTKRNSWKMHPVNSDSLNRMETRNSRHINKGNHAEHFKGYSNKHYQNYKHPHLRTNPLKAYLKLYSYYPMLTSIRKYRTWKNNKEDSERFKEGELYPGGEGGTGSEESYWDQNGRREEEEYPRNYRSREVNGYRYKVPQDRRRKHSFFEISKEHLYEKRQKEVAEHAEPEDEDSSAALYESGNKRPEDDGYTNSNSRKYHPKISYYNYVNKDRLFYGGSRKGHRDEENEEREKYKSKHRVGWHWHDADEGHVGWFWHSPPYNEIKKDAYRKVWQGQNDYRD